MNNKKEMLNVIPTAFAIPFLITIFGPLELYFNNQQEFWFDFYILFPPLFVFFIALFFTNFVILCILQLLNPKYCKLGVCIEFIAFICLYIQGNFFSKSLPALDGSKIDWLSFQAETMISIVLWLFCAGITIILWIRVFKNKMILFLRYAFLVIELVLVFTLFILCIFSGGLKQKQSFTITQKNMLEMSSDENFIILLLDALDSKAFSRILETHPEYYDIFSDFTYYPDTLAGYPYTTRSIPFILSGEWFENQESFESYCANVYKNSSLLNALEASGYKLGFYDEALEASESIYRFENISNRNQLSSAIELGIKEINLALFKYMPYGTKQYFYFDTKEFNNLRASIDDEVPFTSNNLKFYNALKTQPINVIRQNCFRFIHIEGAHVPFQYDAEMNVIENGTYEQNIEASMTIAEKYIEKLKEYNVYDNSVIIIMADHGYETQYRQTPIFMVKGRDEKQDKLLISDKAVSYEDLPDIYERLLNGNKGSNIIEEQQVKRRFLYYEYLEEDSMAEYEQIGFAWDDNTMIQTGRLFNANQKKQEDLDMRYLENKQQSDVTAEVHIDVAKNTRNIEDNSFNKNELLLYGWAVNPIQDEKAKAIYAEVAGQLYEAEPMYRADLYAWKEHYGWCGFKVTIPSNISNIASIYVVTEDDQVLQPIQINISEYLERN